MRFSFTHFLSFGFVRPKEVDKEVTLSVPPDDRHQIGIVGCGKMGISIACELLRRGCTIFMWDNNAFRRHSVRKSVHVMLLTFCCFDKIHIEQMLQRLHVAEHLEELIDCPIPTVIEAVSEDVDIKQQVFADIFEILKLNCVAPDRVCICSNSMSIPIEQVVNGLDEVYSHRCIGLRFLDPVVLIDRVEVTAPQSPNAIYVLRTVETMLRSMQFKPSLSDKLSGQRLSPMEWRVEHLFSQIFMAHAGPGLGAAAPEGTP